MSIDRIDNVWAENGTLEAESAFEADASAGFVDQRVRYSRLNRILYRIETTLDKLLDRGPKRGAPTATEEMLLTGLYPDVSALSDANTVDTVKGTVNFWAFALAEIEGSRKLIIGDDQEDLTLDIVDIDTMTLESQQTISAASLPTTSNAQYPVAIHCDTDTAYIVWREATANDNRLQAYNLSDWAVKTGWPATGLSLWNDSGTLYNISLIDATDTLLGVPNPTQTVTASTDPAVQFVSKAAGTVTSSGAGDQTSGSGPLRICSNGTYVFTGAGYSIDISSPSSGCGGTNWPRTVTAAIDVACLGDLVFWTANGSNVGYVGHVDNALIGTVTSGDASICKDLGRVTTDGLYFWAQGVKTVGATDRQALFKVDVGGVMGENSSTAEVVGEEIITPVAIDNAATHPTTVAAGDQPIVFDGEGIWCLPDQDEDVFRRVPRINLR